MKRLLLLILIFMIGIEIRARWRERPVPEPAYVWDPSFGVRLKPNQHRHYLRATINGGQEITWTTNSQGFRGPELQQSALRRIVVYGDSNIQAQFSFEQHTFSRQLERLLTDQTSKPFEVINAGTIGTGPDQNLLRMETEIERLQPDLIVFHLFANNDFGDLIRNRFFRLNAQGALVRTAYRPETDRSFLSTHTPWYQLRLTRYPAWTLALLFPQHPDPRQQVEEGIRHCKVEWNAYESSQGGLFAQFADHYDFDLALFPREPSSRTKVQLMQAILKKAAEVASKHQARFVLLIEPASEDLTENTTPNHIHFQERSADYRPDRLSSTLEEIAKEENIPYLNLYSTFQHTQPHHLYFVGNDHWNNEGQRLAAETLIHMGAFPLAEDRGADKTTRITADAPKGGVSNVDRDGKNPL